MNKYDKNTRFQNENHVIKSIQHQQNDWMYYVSENNEITLTSMYNRRIKQSSTEDNNSTNASTEGQV